MSLKFGITFVISKNMKSLFKGYVIFCTILLYLSIVSYVDVKIYSSKDKLERKANEILWKKDVKLNWGNFQGIPDTTSSHSASTSSGIDFSYIEQGIYISFDFSTYFDQSKSWIKIQDQTHRLLAHEQLHFDISELTARKIRRDCFEFKTESKSFDAVVNIVKDIYAKNNLFKKSLNQQYDLETEHGTVVEKQIEWEKNITSELTSLNKYSSPKILKRFSN